ncbi:Uncharacterised protein [Candidatus Anstonella stagnisolia]|nr:Uncharacterised protein [Candidatus Anstonella stagnisolia]
MATSREKLIESLNNSNEEIRLDALVEAETGAKAGSKDAMHAIVALVYALGDSNELIAEAAKDAIIVLLNEVKVNTFTLSSIKNEIENDN